MQEEQNYAMVGDGRSAALISAVGSVDWLAWPNFAAAPLFSACVDPARGGHFAIKPQNIKGLTRCYTHNAPILISTFETQTGQLVCTEFMVVATPQSENQRVYAQNTLVRRIECTQGHVVVDVSYAPRPLGGAVQPKLIDGRALGVRFEHQGQLIALHTTAKLVLREDGAAVGRLIVRMGESVDFVLTSDSDTCGVVVPLRGALTDLIETTRQAWQSFANRLVYDGPYREQVQHHALISKLLTFAPSGGLVTGLMRNPQQVGLQSAALTTETWWRLGYQDEAQAFARYIAQVCATDTTAHAAYALFGKVTHASTTLSIYGEVIESLGQIAEHTNHLDKDVRTLLVELGEYVCTHFSKPDAGYFAAGSVGQHVHGWAAGCRSLNRLLALKIRGLLPRLNTSQVQTARDAIVAQLNAQAYSTSAQAFTETLGGSQLACTSLLLPRQHWVDAHDNTMQSTVRALHARLAHVPGHFYANEASRERGDGAYVPASFWLCDVLARSGQTTQAHAQMSRALRCATGTGLLAEHLPANDTSNIGTFPYAPAHIAFLAAASTLAMFAEQHDSQPLPQAANIEGINEDAESQRPKSRRGKRRTR